MDADANSVYHARQDNWQQHAGFNSMYDFFFDVGANAAASIYPFTHGGQDYRFWAWKGDYINLGAGAELGIYYKSLIPGHWGVDQGLALKMSMTLSYNGNPIASYNPSELHWWITSFNPAYAGHNIKPSDLKTSFTVDFSTNTGMFNSFYKYWGNDSSPWTFNRNNYTATLTW